MISIEELFMAARYVVLVVCGGFLLYYLIK